MLHLKMKFIPSFEEAIWYRSTLVRSVYEMDQPAVPKINKTTLSILKDMFKCETSNNNCFDHPHQMLIKNLG